MPKASAVGATFSSSSAKLPDDPLGFRGGARGVKDGGNVAVGVERGLRLAPASRRARRRNPRPRRRPSAPGVAIRPARSLPARPVRARSSCSTSAASSARRISSMWARLVSACTVQMVGAVAHRAEIDDQVLQRVARQERHAVVRAQPARARSAAPTRPAMSYIPAKEIARSLVDAVDEDLVRKPRGGVFQPREKRMFPLAAPEGARVPDAVCGMVAACLGLPVPPRVSPGAGRSQARVVPGEHWRRNGALAGCRDARPRARRTGVPPDCRLPPPGRRRRSGPPGQAASGPRARRRAGNSRPGRARSGRPLAGRARRSSRAPRRPGTDRSKAAGTPGCPSGWRSTVSSVRGRIRHRLTKTLTAALPPPKSSSARS